MTRDLAMVYDGSTALLPLTRRDGQPWSHDRKPEESPGMGIFRLYSGEDGESHI